jgi:hypothetical protein
MVSKKYVVSCYNPTGLKIKPGDKVEVQGKEEEEDITANAVTNPADKGTTYTCGPPMEIAAKGRHRGKGEKSADVKGKVAKVTQSPLGFEFELIT